jgi:hypothetical protein
MKDLRKGAVSNVVTGIGLLARSVINAWQRLHITQCDAY